jgi:RNA polymerase sigma factor (sigma-70 family)
MAAGSVSLLRTRLSPPKAATGPVHEKSLSPSVQRLPQTEREVFDLLWYEGLTQAEAALVLGVTERTIKNRWRSAKLGLQRLLGDGPSG